MATRLLPAWFGDVYQFDVAIERIRVYVANCLNQQLMIFGLQEVVCKSLAKLRAERELMMSAVAGCP
jgi:hypothetical protein